LFEKIKTEKQRRQRGKRLNLVSEESNSAQIFPPSQVRVALDYAAAKKAEAGKAAKVAKKAQAAENKQKKETEAQEKAL
jgi:hypothetical protein